MQPVSNGLLWGKKGLAPFSDGKWPLPGTGAGAGIGNVLLRREQYRLADDQEYSAKMATSFVTGKIVNCRTVLRGALRDHSGKMNESMLRKSIDDLSRSLRSLELNQTLDEVRGLEGDAAHNYFNIFDHLIVAQKRIFLFRNATVVRRWTKLIAYCHFYIRFWCMIAGARWNRLVWIRLWAFSIAIDRDVPAWPLDLMEEFRPFLADRLALSLSSPVRLT